MAKYLGTYSAVVVDVKDPKKLGRVKVRVPVLHGMEQDMYIDNQSLPWALPAGLPGGGSSLSGGFTWLPIIGDQIWVRFLDGQLEKPIWEWGTHPIGKDMYGVLNTYDDKDGSPTKRGAFTRYGHWLEIKPEEIVARTANKYYLSIKSVNEKGQQNSGSLNLVTAKGGLLSLDDSTDSLTASIPAFYAVCQDINFWANITVIITTPIIELNFGQIQLGGLYPIFEIDGVLNTRRGISVYLNALGQRTIGPTVLSASSMYLTTLPKIQDPITGIPAIPAWSGFSMRYGKVLFADSPLADGDGCVRLKDLQLALRLIKIWLMSHVHKGVKSGNNVSGPPTNKPTLVGTASFNVRAEALTKALKAI